MNTWLQGATTVQSRWRVWKGWKTGPHSDGVVAYQLQKILPDSGRDSRFWLAEFLGTMKSQGTTNNHCRIQPGITIPGKLRLHLMGRSSAEAPGRDKEI